MVANTGLGSGDEVDVRENPLSATSLNTHIPTLLGRGVTVAGFLPPVTDDPDPTPVTIPDANLRAVLERMMFKASGAMITRGEMLSVTRIEARGMGIRDLTGLEFATNLEYLNFGVPLGVVISNSNAAAVNSNEISNLSPLSGLPNLTLLYLSGNAISDISSLSGLPNLEILWLDGNAISDISPLSGLTNLVELNLSGNALSNSDSSALFGLTNLIQLDLRDNLLTDISWLSGLTGLTELDLSNNSISDISPLSGLTGLTSLSLSGNSISDISPLSGLTNLTWLYSADTLISDISPLRA